jgi:hypothetical protein
MARQLSHDVGDDILNEIIGQFPGFSEFDDVMFYIENIATLIVALIDWLKNKDDKVREHSYAWSHDYFARKGSHGLILGFNVNGGGRGWNQVYSEFKVQ